MIDRAQDNRIFRAMVEDAVSELSNVMKVSIGERAKNLIKRAMGRSVHVSDPMFWPAGMLMLGLSEARMVITARKDDSEVGKAMIELIDRAVSDHVDLWNNKYGSRITFVDDALAGVALIKMFDQTSNEKYRSAAQKIYEFIANAPCDETGSIIYNASKGNRNIFADGVGQTSMFLSLYGRMFDAPKALEMARTQLINFKKYGMDDRSGLCYHGYELRKDSIIGDDIKEVVPGSNDVPIPEKKGLLGWGRAMGWLMMGLSVSAAEDVNSNLGKWYREMAANVVSYCKPDGGYSWQIQAVDGHFDASATGMLLYSLLAGIDSFDVQPDEGDGSVDMCGREYITGIINKSCDAVFKNTEVGGRVGSALSSCDDFGVHYQTYGHYPWGQGAALAAVSLALRQQ